MRSEEDNNRAPREAFKWCAFKRCAIMTDLRGVIGVSYILIRAAAITHDRVDNIRFPAKVEKNKEYQNEEY